MIMDFQVVVLAGRTSEKLVTLVSKEVPKALLPAANPSVLPYVLVFEGQDAAVHVGHWISGVYADHPHVEVAKVLKDVGTAGALWAIADHLTSNDILVVSGDVCDASPGAVAAAHRQCGDTVTTLLFSVPVCGPVESESSVEKDKTKKPGCCKHHMAGSH